MISSMAAKMVANMAANIVANMAAKMAVDAIKSGNLLTTKRRIGTDTNISVTGVKTIHFGDILVI